MRNSRQVISLRINPSLHFAAKSSALHLGKTLEELYGDALRFYLLYHCPKILDLLRHELQPPLNADERAIIEQALRNKS